MRMLLRAVTLFLALVALPLTAIAKTENWIEVHTPNFIILTNAGDKQARRIADQFERMRAVFRKRFPKASVDAASPIIVIALKDKKDFQALEPQEYLAKGQLDLAGLFLQGPEKNYVLLRLDADGDHPYATVYHEYTHFIVRKAAGWLPLWLNEGWAEFYQNTEIKEKEVGMGEASAENLILLRQSRPLPLATLLAVDHNSPYYHEENRASIFYAESWALTHYLTIKDQQDKTDRLADYVKLVSNNVDPVAAATQAFGDLKTLEINLKKYISQASFYYVRMPGAIEVDDASFQVEAVTPDHADTIRADFLAYNRRNLDARALLDRVLKDDPNNAADDETMGFLAFRESNFDEAAKWYEKAVRLDSQSYLAHYYFAAIAMSKSPSPERNAEIEASLRSSIKLNPAFAPAFDQLAVFYAMQHKNLNEAAMLNLQAIDLDRSNINYRINRSNLMMTMERPSDAIAVLKNALKLASKPEELSALQNQLQSIQQFQTALQAQALQYQRDKEEAASRSQASGLEGEAMAPTQSESPEATQRGPRRTARGTLRNIRCTGPAVMTLAVEGGKSPLALRARNYFKVEYSALNFKPSGDLNPCKDLEGVTAKVEYFESTADSADGQIISIEISK